MDLPLPIVTRSCSMVTDSIHFQVLSVPEVPIIQQHQQSRSDLNKRCNRGSHCSDTSSAYSGSGTMTSIHSSSLDVDEVDLSGLVESVVDSDEEDLAESMDSLAVRDTVRECLEKDPSDRTDEDIETLLEFTKNLRAFTNMTLAVRRALCSVMVFAVVEKAGTMVMNNGEELDSWSVLINGHVQIEHTDGSKDDLQVGDCFGILPTMLKLYHRGVMRTTCHDCQFVCITQSDYYRIHHQGEENTQKHEEDGQLVMVTELRPASSEGGQRHGHVVIRGTPERLMMQLIENSMTDSTYVEDFLLTHRTFTSSAQSVAQQLLTWFETESTQHSVFRNDGLTNNSTNQSPLNSPIPPSVHSVICSANATTAVSTIRDRVAIVVLLWVNNHFTDFETDPLMMEFLETFEAGLERRNMHDRLRLLHFACAAKARTRTLTLARSSRGEPLKFEIIGGYERGSQGIFVSNVVRRSKPEEKGLKRGDQILEVNGHSFEHVTNARAIELLTNTTHLSITVKSNLLAFKDLLAAGEDSTDSPRSRNVRRKALSDIAKLQHGSTGVSGFAGARLSSIDMLTPDQNDFLVNNGMPLPYTGTKCGPTSSKKDHNTHKACVSTLSSATGGTGTLGTKRRLQKALIKMNLLPKNAVNMLMDNLITTGIADEDSASGAGTNSTSSGSASSLHNSQSNPDLTTTINMANTASSATYYDEFRNTDYPEHVLKVYRADQSCKYLLVHKETTAHEVVMLALQEFGCHESSSMFSLCEVSVGDGGMIKQRRLPEQLQNLAERIGLAARYYLKTNGLTETLVPDEMAPELIRDAAVHFLQLNANELAIQLTLQDFAIFRQIEATEYVDDLFAPSSHTTAAIASAPNADTASTISITSTSTTSSSTNTYVSTSSLRYGVPMLRQFAELVNHEMFWVVTEVCSESNLVRRMRIIKQFVKIARHCKECRNFNSMFAIVSGLGHASVSRLRLTWEKLPGKYHRLFEDLQDLMDPSRNMSKYRQLVSAEMAHQHPIIPFYPVVKKDLTFIHLGNDTIVDGLINFEKLRMIAKEVRSLTKMCSKDLMQALELKGQPPSSAMVALNQMSITGIISGSGSVSSGSLGSATLGSVIGGLGAIGLGGGQATVKRRKKSTAVPNPKKMFEEAQMVRRVKSYLNNIRVITDEDRLHQLSLDCEPASTGGSGSTGSGGGGSASGAGSASIGSSSGSSAPNTASSNRRRHPSPTLSTASSNSSASEAGRKGAIAAASAAASAVNNGGVSGPKFGTASPHAVKKILSLSETTKTRPHQPRHPGAPASVTNLGSVNNLNLQSAVKHQAHPLHGIHYLMVNNNGNGPSPSSSGLSPTPSPGAHRRVGSTSSAGSIPYSGVHLSNDYANMVPGSRGAVHERSYSDTRSSQHIEFIMEGTSVNNPPLRMNKPSAGSITSNDSGHGSCAHTDHLDSTSSSVYSGVYEVASSIVHNTPPPTLMKQRRNSALTNAHAVIPPPPSLPASKLFQHQIHQPHHAQLQSQQPILPPRLPPSYNVAAQMSRINRLGRARSHEGVLDVIPPQQPQHVHNLKPQLSNSVAGSHFYFKHSNSVSSNPEDDDEDAQVSAV